MEVRKNSVHFKLGNFECMVVSDGECIVPLRQDEEITPQDNPQTMYTKLDMQFLLIKTGKHTILVDTGWGNGMEEGGGDLIQNLQALGVQSKDIDTVTFSHAHPDHIDGNVDADGKPAFSNARYVMYRKEWEFWTSNPDLPDMEEDVKKTSLASVDKNLKEISKPIKVAVMGCVVNGPGEAKDADVGIACGKGKGVIFRKGKMVSTVTEKDFLKALMAEVKSLLN